MIGSNARIKRRVVIDTNIFVPAIAFSARETMCYAAILRDGWHVIFSDQIVDEYQRVIEKFGYRPGVVGIEMSKLSVQGRFRYCDTPQELIDKISPELSPRKDRHIIAPCSTGCADTILTDDGGIIERRDRILQETGATVISLLALEKLCARP